MRFLCFLSVHISYSRGWLQKRILFASFTEIYPANNWKITILLCSTVLSTSINCPLIPIALRTLSATSYFGDCLHMLRRTLITEQWLEFSHQRHTHLVSIYLNTPFPEDEKFICGLRGPSPINEALGEAGKHLFSIGKKKLSTMCEVLQVSTILYESNTTVYKKTIFWKHEMCTVHTCTTNILLQTRRFSLT